MLLGAHFPALLDKLSGLLAKPTSDPSTAKRASTTIGSVQDGQECSVFSQASRPARTPQPNDIPSRSAQRWPSKLLALPRFCFGRARLMGRTGS
jgi:hypothetical protein